MSREQDAGSDGGVVAGIPGPRPDARRLGRLATSDAEVNIRLLSRLAETAITSGDVKTAVEAVRACTAEAENLYQIAAAERAAAAAAAHVAAEQHARALAMQEAAAGQHARALAMQDAATAQRNRAAMLQSEAAALHRQAVAMRDEAEQAKAAAEQAMAEVEAQRKADQRKRTSIPRRLRVSDANGLDLRPDPSTAETPADYIETLRLFRLWAGNPSYRELELRCNGRPVASTICKTLQSTELPSRFEVVGAIVSACGGTEEDRQRFASAWRRLAGLTGAREARSALRVVSDPAPA